MGDGPPASSEAARRRMKATRAKDSKPELNLRSALHRLGLRFRLHQRVIPNLRRTVDVVFRPSRVAVFVDGCFWHGCPEHGTWPKKNAKWWRDKIETNIMRDRETDRLLDEAGWTVVRVWEHERPEVAARRIARLVRRA